MSRAGLWKHLDPSVSRWEDLLGPEREGTPGGSPVLSSQESPYQWASILERLWWPPAVSAACTHVNTDASFLSSVSDRGRKCVLDVLTSVYCYNMTNKTAHRQMGTSIYNPGSRPSPFHTRRTRGTPCPGRNLGSWGFSSDTRWPRISLSLFPPGLVPASGPTARSIPQACPVLSPPRTRANPPLPHPHGTDAHREIPPTQEEAARSWRSQAQRCGA